MRTTAIAVIAAIIVTIPTSVAATHLFTDVTDDHPHADGIAYATETGTTQGCRDGSDYCPDRPVTRDQMATFLHRQSGNADVAPSVNAARLQGLAADDLQRRVSGTCQAGTFVTHIGEDGSVQCGTLDLDVHIASYTAAGGTYVQCPVGYGYVATGGGFTSGEDTNVYMSEPAEPSWDQAWTSRAVSPDSSFAPATTAYVMCVRLVPDGG